MVSLNAEKAVRKAVEKISGKTGQKIEIKGKVGFKPGFSPCITVNDISFGKSSIQKLMIYLEFAPLVRGEVRVKHLRVRETRIVIERGRDGMITPDFQDGLRRAAESESGGSGAKDLVMENCRIIFMDLKNLTGLDIAADELKAEALQAVSSSETDHRFKLDIVSRSLEVASFTPDEKDGEPPCGEKLLFPDGQERLPVPDSVNFAGRIHVKKLVLAGSRLRDVKTEIAIKSGRPDGMVHIAKKGADLREVMAAIAGKAVRGDHFCASVLEALGEAANENREY
ncbi:MAG: hypothetical protein R6V41_00620 [Desulfobacteraceae bacterium]